MVLSTQLSIGVSIASGAIALGLLVFGIRAYLRTRDPRMIFVAGAFFVFLVKSLLVAYGLFTGTPGHQDLELLDAIGDLTVLALLVAPLLRPRPTE